MPMKQINDLESGLVVSYFGNSVAVETQDEQVFQCHLRRNQTLPVVGDRVRWQKVDETSVAIIEILPRRSELLRSDKQGKPKAIAANLDLMIIVTAPPPIFSEYLIDRYLAAAELLQIPAMVVLNKIDLVAADKLDAMAELLQPYPAIQYPTLLTSVYNKRGLTELNHALVNKMAVLVGVSGVGKSSIIAALSAHAPRIAAVSDKGAGKHTTTATRLYHLQEGGALIDSPGVREFNLWPVTEDVIRHGFKEFQNYIGLCKFRDCRHLAEPHCAVKLAVAQGNISQKRYEIYQLLLKENKIK